MHRRRIVRRAAALVAAAFVATAPLTAPVRADDAVPPLPPRVPVDGGPSVAVPPDVGLILDAMVPGDAGARFTAADALAKLPWQVLVDALQDPGPDRDGSRGRALCDAIAFGGARVATEMLEGSVGPTGTPSMRLAALRNAARPDAGVPIEDVLTIACAATPAERTGIALCAALRSAVAATLRRKPGEVRAVVTRWRDLTGAARNAVLDGIEEAGRLGGARALGALVPFVTEGRSVLLDRLARAPFRCAEPIGLSVDTDIDRCLDDGDRGVRATAAILAGRIGGLDRADRLRRLLTDADPVVVASARRGLEAASGIRLIPDADLWKIRLDEERAWAARTAPEEIARLASADPAVVCAALARLATKRLHAASIAPRVAELLTSASPAVRLAACDALARLGSPRSIPALVRVLGEQDSETVAAASAALATITSLPRPADPSRWTEALSPDER